jgi:Site-specific recombinases, DNA invertase Pin homologs
MNIKSAREELINGKTIYDMNLRVAYYARVSTEKEDQLNSLENQSNYFTEMIKDNSNWTFIDSYIDEGLSGTAVKKRESFLKMINDAESGKLDLILTKEISRFSRNTVDSIKYTEILLKNGVIVHFLTDNLNTIFPDSEFRLAIMSSLAQDEVRKLSERVKFGMKRMIKDGKLIGGSNLTGYFKKNGKLIINEEEREIIEMIFNLYGTGKYSLLKISDKLKEKGYLNTKGNPYSDTTIRKIILNPRYKGYYTANISYIEDYKTHKKILNHKDEWIMYKDESKCPPIVNEKLWNKANEVLKKRSKHLNKTIISNQSYLENGSYTSKLFCKEHGCNFIKKGSGKRSLYPTWQCDKYLRHGLKGCDSPIIKEEALNNIFIKEIKKNIGNFDELKDIMVNQYKIIFEDYFHDSEEEKTIKKINKIKKQKEKLLSLHLDDIITSLEFDETNNKLTGEINILKENLTQLKNTYDMDGKNLIEIDEKITKILDIEKSISIYVKLLIDKIVISKIDNSRVNLEFNIKFKGSQKTKNIKVSL